MGAGGKRYDNRPVQFLERMSAEEFSIDDLIKIYDSQSSEPKGIDVGLLFSQISQNVDVGGASIFVTDVEPVNTGKTVQKTYLPGTVGEQVVTGFSTDDTTVRVHLFIDGGKDFSGSYTANGVAVTLTKIANARAYTGEATLDIQDTEVILIEGNGGKTSLAVQRAQSAPDIVALGFESYPDGQTELKTGDVLTAQVTFSDIINVTHVVVSAYGAFGTQTVPITPISSNTARISLTVNHDHSAATASLRGARLKSRIDSGSTGADYTTGNILACNNLKPSISIQSVTYPTNQSALKDSESATVNISYSEVASWTISSPELDIVNPTGVAATKTVSLNASGRTQGYRDTGTNFTITAKRGANGAQNTISGLVQIAHVDVSLQSNTLLTLRESGNIDLSLTQKALQLTPAITPVGTLGTLTGSDKSYQQQIIIVDSDLRAATTLTLSIEATNLAGKVTLLERSYRVLGFGPKTLTYLYASFQQTVPVNIVDPAKLVVNGSVNASPPFALSPMIRNAALELATHYDLVGNDLKISTATESFGYSNQNTVTVTIEEQAADG